MKNLFLVMALAFGLMSFSSSSDVDNKLSSDGLSYSEIVETSSFCDYYTRRCFYRGGELIGCTAWECNIVLDEIIL